MSKQLYICEQCGAEIWRYPGQMKGKQHVFCSQSCLAKAKAEGVLYPKIKHPHLSEYNRQHNKERMTPEVREKLRQSRLRLPLHGQPLTGGSHMMTPEIREKLRKARLDSGRGTGYRKYYGRHEHRVVAEKMLGRPLEKGEVVHHINGDKRDNRPENLMVFKSQAEHARWHKLHDRERR